MQLVLTTPTEGANCAYLFILIVPGSMNIGKPRSGLPILQAIVLSILCAVIKVARKWGFHERGGESSTGVREQSGEPEATCLPQIRAAWHQGAFQFLDKLRMLCYKHWELERCELKGFNLPLPNYTTLANLRSLIVIAGN